MYANDGCNISLLRGGEGGGAGGGGGGGWHRISGCD